MNDPTQTLWQVDKTNIVCAAHKTFASIHAKIMYNDGAFTESRFEFPLPPKPEHIWMARMTLRQFHETTKHQTSVTTFINEEFKALFGKELEL